MKTISEQFRILIVEDSRELREMLQDMLENETTSAVSVSNGSEALEKYRLFPFDLIITDLNMPGISGTELMRIIRQEDEDVEFIIITGYASLETAVEAIKAGAFDYIVKPFKIDELLVGIKNVRDKVTLKKKNRALLDRLSNFYEEIDRYKYNKVTSYKEKIVKEVENLNLLKKEGILKEDEFDDFKKRILERIL